MANIGSLVLSLQARTQSLEKQLNRANGLIRKLQKETQGIGNSARRAENIAVRSFSRISVGANGITTRIVAASRAMRAFAAAAAGAIAAGFIARTIAATDEIGKFADRIGVGVEELQELRFVAAQSGVQIRSFDTALQRFTRRAAEAAQGTGEARDTFRDLGVRLTDTQGRMRTTSDLLKEVADRFGLIPTQADRVRAAFKLFDTEGVALVNVLRLGSAGITDLTQKAQRLGIVLSEDTVRRAEAANDQLDIIQRVISTRVSAAVLKLTPQITRLGESFARVVERTTDFQASIDGITSREENIARFLSGTTDLARGLAGAFLDSAEAVQSLIERLTDRALDFFTGRSRPPGITRLNPNLPPLASEERRTPRISIDINRSSTERRRADAIREQEQRIRRIRENFEREERRAQAARDRVESELDEVATLLERRTAQAARRLEPIQNAVTSTFDAISSAVSNAAIGVARGTQSISDAVRNMVDSIAASLLSTGINQLLSLLSQFAVTSIGNAIGGQSATPAAPGAPTVTPIAAGSFVPRGATVPRVTVINVANQEQAFRLEALELAAGRSVTIEGLANDISSRGNGSPVVRSLRNTLGR